MVSGEVAADMPLSQSDFRRLAEFRFQLRKFVHVSQEAAEKAGIHPKQHQLLLAVVGMPAGVPPTIQNVATRLMIRHNSCVELVDRCIEQGLIQRTPDSVDRRRVLLRLTPRGQAVLETLAMAHIREFRELGPKLIQGLQAILEIPAENRTEDLQAGAATR